MKEGLIKIVYIVVVLLAVLGIIASPVALLLGFVFSLLFHNPFKTYSYRLIHVLLKISVVGLGFGMYIKETFLIGKATLSLTFFSILLTLCLGLLFTKILGVDKKLGYLITSGTSICGGSAIAAISPIIKAKAKTISVGLGIVFLLNAIALFVFPAIGHWLDLTQGQFGMWCAVAIHDTSSVVGAALGYGGEALKIATTVKLARTLWILPLSLVSMFLFQSKKRKIQVPYFILLFVLAIVLNSYDVFPVVVTHYIVLFSKRLLVITLFIVGSTILIQDLKQIGVKPLVLAFVLWGFISVFSLMYILCQLPDLG